MIKIILTLLLISAKANAVETDSYGAYSLVPLGSTRTLGMGGAFAALSDDASGIYANPAGVALSRWRWNLSTGSNRVVNKEVDLTGDNKKDGLPYLFQYYAVAGRFGAWAIAAGLSSPFKQEMDFFGFYNYKIFIENYSLLISKQWNKKVALGVTIVSEKATLTADETLFGGGSIVSGDAELVYPRIGISFRNGNRTGFGIYYVAERKYTIDPSLNAQVGLGNTFFRDVTIPAKIALGAFIGMGSRIIWVADIDFYQATENMIFTGSPLQSEIPIDNDQKSVLHGGFEMTIVKSSLIDFIWRGGGYQEPPRTYSANERFHFTMGVSFRYSLFTISASYDQAEGFSNTAQTYGINFSAIN